MSIFSQTFPIFLLVCPLQWSISLQKTPSLDGKRWETQFAGLIDVCKAQPDSISAVLGFSFMPTQLLYQLRASAHHIILSFTAQFTSAANGTSPFLKTRGLSNFQECLRPPPNLEQVLEPLSSAVQQKVHIFFIIDGDKSWSLGWPSVNGFVLLHYK